MILGSFFRYSATSIVSWLVEFAVLSLLMFWVFKAHENENILILGIPFAFRALVAKPIARLVSAPLNYWLNRDFVFKDNRDRGTVKRYIVLAVCSLVVTTLLFAFLDHFLGASAPILHLLLNIVIDVAMYVVNFRIQQRWVFGKRAK